jgi:enediyne biosynthesis protein E4
VRLPFLKRFLRFCALALLWSDHAFAQQSATSKNNQEPSSIRFENIADKLNLHFKYEASATSQKYLPETMGSGIALFDFDNDGRLDIFVVNGARIDDPMPKGAMPVKDAPKYWNRLFHQRKDGAFEDVTEKAGLAGVGYGMGVAVADYDNDGYDDLYVTAFGGNRLYHNNGDGTFTDITAKAGVAASGWSTSAAFFDYDNDGKLDLVVARYMDWSFEKNIYCGEKREGYRQYCKPDLFNGASLILYHNDGGGHFTDVTQKAGLGSTEGRGLGLAIADFDHDGNIDLFVANDSSRQCLYRNKGDGTFEDVAMQAGVSVDGDGKTYAGMGVDFSDYDNDGWPDLVITNLANQKYAVYQNQGDGTFDYASYATGIGGMTLLHSGWGMHLADFDNDGRKDLLIGQAHVMDNIELNFPHLRYKESPLIARNVGKEFEDVSATAGEVFQQRFVARGMATGDIDNDGRLDAVINSHDGGLYLLHNISKNPNHWLTLKLEGRTSNRDGIGAQIKLTAESGATQYLTVSTTGSYLSASDRRAHFGLGSEATAKQIEIRWPSGIVQKLENVRADQILAMTEPAKTTGNVTAAK